MPIDQALQMESAPGLRAAPGHAGPTSVRELEAWFASQLDHGPEAALPKGVGRKERSASATAQPGSWARLRVQERAGATVVAIPVAALVSEVVLCETRDELLALVQAGHDRLVIDLGDVQRLSSPFLAILAEAHRRCAACAGGGVRLCGLQADFRAIVELTGLSRSLRMYPDTVAALADPWPAGDRPRPLPVNVVAPLLAAGAAPSRSPEYQPLVLRVQGGPHDGKRITVQRDGFVIGRDAGCPLHCAADSVSRQHAALVWGAAGWQVMDLSSTNGTWHNGRRVDRPRSLRTGDVIRVGPLSLVVATPGEAVSGSVEAALDLAIPDEAGRETRSDPEAPGVPLEAIAGVWVMAPRHAAVPDDAALDTWRATLERLAARSDPARVVLDLEHVAELPSRAVGLLVAWAIELKGRGGALRLAHPQASVRARLEWLRVPMLVPLYLQRDEAVIAAWE